MEHFVVLAYCEGGEEEDPTWQNVIAAASSLEKAKAFIPDERKLLERALSCVCSYDDEGYFVSCSYCEPTDTYNVNSINGMRIVRCNGSDISIVADWYYDE